MSTPSMLIFLYQFKVTVGPKRSTNRNLKEIITRPIKCMKTVIFHFLRPQVISQLAKREMIYHKMNLYDTIICHKMNLFLSRSNYVSLKS